MNFLRTYSENPMKRALTLLLLVASLAIGAAAQKQTPPAGSAPKPFTVPAAQNFTLPNGLKVTMVPYGDVPKVTITTVIDSGNPRNKARRCRQSTTCLPVSDSPASNSGHSRLNWSTIVSTRKEPPLANRSAMKSIDQRWFGPIARAKGTRGWAARFFRAFVRTDRFSSR